MPTNATSCKRLQAHATYANSCTRTQNHANLQTLRKLICWRKVSELAVCERKLKVCALLEFQRKSGENKRKDFRRESIRKLLLFPRSSAARGVASADEQLGCLRDGIESNPRGPSIFVIGSECPARQVFPLMFCFITYSSIRNYRRRTVIEKYRKFS